MNYEVREMISSDEIDKRVKEIAGQITEDFKGEQVKFVCILKGAAFFACDLARYTDLDVKLDFMAISSYGNSNKSMGVCKIIKDLDETIEDQNIIIVEDIIDSGITLSYLSKILGARGAKCIKICTLLNKPSRREKAVNVDYCGFDIGNDFVVGYGLDYAQNHRALPYIGKVVETRQ